MTGITIVWTIADLVMVAGAGILLVLVAIGVIKGLFDKLTKAIGDK